jgi:hypothetical protein
MGAVVLVDPAGGGVGHGDDQPIDWRQRWPKAAMPTALDRPFLCERRRTSMTSRFTRGL